MMTCTARSFTIVSSRLNFRKRRKLTTLECILLLWGTLGSTGAILDNDFVCVSVEYVAMQTRRIALDRALGIEVGSVASKMTRLIYLATVVVTDFGPLVSRALVKEDVSRDLHRDNHLSHFVPCAETRRGEISYLGLDPPSSQDSTVRVVARQTTTTGIPIGRLWPACMP